MTKEDQKQIEELTAFVSKLNPYAKHLGTSLHGYINIRPEDTRRLFESYYGPDWKTKVKPNALTCGTCKLNIIKGIAIEYEGAKHTIERIMSKDKTKDKTKDKKKKDVNVE